MLKELQSSTKTLPLRSKSTNALSKGQPGAPNEDVPFGGADLVDLTTFADDLRTADDGRSQAAITFDEHSFEARNADIRRRIEKLTAALPIAKDTATAATPATAAATVKPAATKSEALTMDDSRPHSPSPASFSRPRPSSNSRSQSGQGFLSGTPSVTMTRRAVPAQRTASRIPIPDSKKATLVDIRNRRSSGTLTPRSATPRSEYGPSFGSRRLDAPDFLKTLDQGAKRRPMRRTSTRRGSTTTEASSAYGANEYPGTPALDRSEASTPDVTVGASSSDEEEVVTPIYKPVGFGSGANSKDERCYHETVLQLFDHAVDEVGPSPPPTSPLSGPLPTIPSQSVLPTQSFRDDEITSSHSREHSEMSTLKHASQTPGMSTLNERFSQLYNTHAEHSASSIGDHELAPEATKSALMDLLAEYGEEERRQSSSGHSTLHPAAKKHISQALSMLEGKGDPPMTRVDNEQLLHMFNSVKRGIEKTTKLTNSLAMNAAAAEKFLTRTQDLGVLPDDVQDGHPAQSSKQAQLQLAKHAQEDNELAQSEGVASKWSDSTVSLQFPPRDQSSSSSSKLSSKNIHRRPVPPSRSPPKPPSSIGFPSRVGPKASQLLGPGSDGVASPHSPTHRQPFANHQPGSVRAARENINGTRGGFAAPTASADSKKLVRTAPSNTKALSVMGEIDRGRGGSAQPCTLTNEISGPATKVRESHVCLE
jgi:hypothetical protein